MTQKTAKKSSWKTVAHCTIPSSEFSLAEIEQGLRRGLNGRHKNRYHCKHCKNPNIQGNHAYVASGGVCKNCAPIVERKRREPESEVADQVMVLV